MIKQKLSATDKVINGFIRKEKKRQNTTLNLIASENFASRAVMEALGSVFTNKYSEGMPRRRYYAGNRFVDDIEEIAIERAKKLFGAEHVNVQPYSGSPANFEVYFALLEFGDTVLAMNLAHGGHLTHGHSVNFSGKAYKFVHYGVSRETEMIDYDEVRRIAHEIKPKLILSGASAYPRTIDFKAFDEIADEVGAYSMADIAHIAGLVAAGVHPSPLPFTDVVTTTTHKTLRGPRAAIIMCKSEFAKKIDSAVFPGMQGGPHDNTIAAIAVAFQEALQPEFREYSQQIVKNAQALAQALMENSFRIVSNGTDNHLLLADMTSFGISGGEAQEALEKANIVVNKNMIPFDQRKPFDPSGIRLGTPALTTRGMKESEMQHIATLIKKVLSSPKDRSAARSVKLEVLELCRRFPLY